ncbi:unnamed protein product, partial [Didymodactylos carnosus]
PSNLFEIVKSWLLQYAQVTTSEFIINEQDFSPSIQPEEMIEKARKFRCFIQVTGDTIQLNVRTPTTLADANVFNIPYTGSASHTALSPQLITSANINRERIQVCFGNLTTRTDDVIVVCSTSNVLRKSVIDAAGIQVSQEYSVQNSQNLIVTSSGSLVCKKILFIPWSPKAKDLNVLKQSICWFTSNAVEYAWDNGYKSIALPAIGCGRFRINADIIAKMMIGEAERQLNNRQASLTISFVMLKQQQSVYDDF